MTEGQRGQLKKQFLKRFGDHGCVRRACTEIGVGHSAVYNWRKKDDTFASGFQDAEHQAVSHLEAEALRRAIDGVDQPVFHGGDQVGSVRKYSDTLLIFLLKARAPDRYRDNYHFTHAGPAGGAIDIKVQHEQVHKLSQAQAAEVVAILSEAGALIPEIVSRLPAPVES